MALFELQFEKIHLLSYGFHFLAMSSRFIVIFITIFTNPSARAEYDTRSVFKRSLTGLNSEFFFS